jgi:hypothetical protein
MSSEGGVAPAKACTAVGVTRASWVGHHYLERRSRTC